MNEIAARERTGRVVAIALGMWVALVGAAALEGVLAKLSGGTLAALAGFALAYAPSMYFLDAGLRAYARGFARPWIAVTAWALVAVLAAAGLARGDAATDAALLARWPIALAALFAAPLAVALSAAALERAGAFRSPAAKRSAARPAAS